MYWNRASHRVARGVVVININMRCIEIGDIYYSKICLCRLTLTWDVLKYCEAIWFHIECRRLTLTWDVLKSFSCLLCMLVNLININMRCIEILTTLIYSIRLLWLTLTWDVLKLTTPRSLSVSVSININMRCIEILPTHIQIVNLRD